MDRVTRFLTISSGSGFGYGDGYGISRFNGNDVHAVDGVQTIIHKVRGNVAHGLILRGDLTTTPTVIVRVGDSFAHGETAKQARADATEKHLQNAPIEVRVEEFLNRFKPETQYPASQLSEGHQMLTGSCAQGRNEFMLARGIKPGDTFTVAEFVEITKSAYGADAIDALSRALLEASNV